MGFHWNKKIKKAVGIANFWNPIGWHYGVEKLRKKYLSGKKVKTALGLRVPNSAASYWSTYQPKRLSEIM